MTQQEMSLLTHDLLTPAQRARMIEGDFLRLGVIGSGDIVGVRNHPSLYAMPAKVEAVCDINETRARQNAKAFGIPHVFTDYTRLLAEVELDGVIVTAGPTAHPQMAIDAMEAGLAVLTEKPPALSASETARMLEASERTGRICMTAFNKRFATIYRRAQAEIAAPGFGGASLLALNWYSPVWFTDDPDRPITWFLLDFGIHAIDVVRFLCGEVEEVYARGADQAYAIALSFANGAVGSVTLSGRRDARLVEQVEVTGANGQSVTLTDGQHLIRYDGSEVGAWHHTAFTITDSFAENGYRGEIAEFLAAIEEGREPESSIASAHETMRLYDAICLSLKSGDPVALADLG